LSKHILLISYYWPPDNSSGVQRWAYFARHLTDLGHTITVISVDPKKASYKNKDDSFSDLVDDIHTIHTDTLEPLKAYSLLTTGSANKGIPRGGVDTSQSTFKKMASWIKENLFIPDARVGWNKYALKAAKSFLDNNPTDLIITTGPPQSTHLIGLSLKKIYPEIKWLADFRDPWTELYSNDMSLKSIRAQNKNKKLELNVLQAADKVLTIGPSMQKLLEDKLSAKMRGKVSYIFNGYDQKKLEDAPTHPSDKFTITFVGLMADDYPYQSFLTVLRALKSEVTNIKLILAGNIADKFMADAKMIKGLEVDFQGFVTHQKSLSLMKSASMLFTILPSQANDEIIVSGKLMEYIAAQKPVLCIGNSKGDAAMLLDKLKAGRVFTAEDTDGISAFLSDCIASKENGQRASSETAKYSRKYTALLLSDLLSEL
jgi:glycosyltransferase involved in cell wall biosynthesis